MSDAPVEFDDVHAYRHALARDPGLAMITYTMAADVFGVTVQTVQGYARKARTIREIVIGDRDHVGVIAADVHRLWETREEEVGGRIPEIQGKLESAVRDRRIVTYSEDLMKPAGLDHKLTQDRHTIGKILGRISGRSLDERGIMLSVVAVKASTRRPNGAFYELARELGVMDADEDEEAFFQSHLETVFAHDDVRWPAEADRKRFDMIGVVNLTSKAAGALIEQASPGLRRALEVFAEAGPVVEVARLYDVGIDDLEAFENEAETLAHAVTDDEEAYFLGWEEDCPEVWPQDETTGRYLAGRYAVTPATVRALRRQFGIGL